MLQQHIRGLLSSSFKRNVTEEKLSNPIEWYKIHLSIIIVVAEVPSTDIEAMSERRCTGMSSRREKRVTFHEETQSLASPLFLDKTNVTSQYTREWKVSDQEKLAVHQGIIYYTFQTHYL